MPFNQDFSMNGTFTVNSNNGEGWEANVTVNNETINVTEDFMNDILDEIANDDF